MSSEYTIDIQLTELGFPEILQPKETPVEDLVASSSPPLSPSPPLHSDTSGARRPADKDRSGAEDPQTNALTQIVHAQQTTTTVSGSTPTQTSSSPPTLNPEDRRTSSVTDTEEVKGGKTTGESKAENGQKYVNGQKAKGNTTGAESEETDDSDVEYVEEEEEEEEDDEEDQEGLEEESSGAGDHRCSVCNLLLPSSFKLQDHMNLHTGVRPYCCAECGKRFCQNHNYRAHLRTHAQGKQGVGGGLDPLRCRVCLKGFETGGGLADHLATSHFETEFYECDLCKRIFTDRKVCEKHMEGHRLSFGDHACDGCGRRFTKLKFLNQHRQRMCQRNYSCTDCARVFRKKNTLLRHSFSHLGLLPYTCVRCRRHFRLAKFYRKHKCEPERIHCVACLGVFLSQEDFQKHKKDTGCWGHQGSRGGEIRCMECGQGFASAEELKQHGGAHQRVLSCSECGKGFRSALLLMSHMGGHAGQRPCLCQSCGLGFPHQQAYDSHLKDCGRAPSANAPKKRPAPKPSPPTTLPKKLKPLLAPQPAAPAPKPAAALVPSAGGMWKLALDKEPPAGVSLVIFVPVNSGLVGASSTTASASATSALSLPLPDGVALPPALAVDLQGASSASSFPGGECSDVPLDLALGPKQPKNVSVPLDLSKKPTSPPALSPEPARPGFPAAASGTASLGGVVREEATLEAKREPGTGGSEERQPDAVDLSSLKASGGRLLDPDVKKEPPSPPRAYGSDSMAPTESMESRRPTRIKTEEDVEGHGGAGSPVCSDPTGEPVKKEAGLNLACEGTPRDGE